MYCLFSPCTRQHCKPGAMDSFYIIDILEVSKCPNTTQRKPCGIRTF